MDTLPMKLQSKKVSNYRKNAKTIISSERCKLNIESGGLFPLTVFHQESRGKQRKTMSIGYFRKCYLKWKSVFLFPYDLSLFHPIDPTLTSSHFMYIFCQC